METVPKSSSFLGGEVCTSLLSMTAKSNKNKKPSSKKTSTKKAAAKKGSPKKKPVANARKESTKTEVREKLEQAKPQFISADAFLKAAASTSSSLVRANDVKSPSLRKRMLAWFTIYK